MMPCTMCVHEFERLQICKIEHNERWQRVTCVKTTTPSVANVSKHVGGVLMHISSLEAAALAHSLHRPAHQAAAFCRLPALTVRSVWCVMGGGGAADHDSRGPHPSTLQFFPSRVLPFSLAVVPFKYFPVFLMFLNNNKMKEKVGCNVDGKHDTCRWGFRVSCRGKAGDSGDPVLYRIVANTRHWNSQKSSTVLMNGHIQLSSVLCKINLTTRENTCQALLVKTKINIFHFAPQVHAAMR